MGNIFLISVGLPNSGIMVDCYRYVIFSYADSGMSNTLEVEEEEEVKIILKTVVFRSLPLLCGILLCSLIIDLT